MLLDPAIQILPHVGLDFAQEAAPDQPFETPEEAIAARLATGAPTPREFLEEEAREHLELVPGRKAALALLPRRGGHRLRRALHRPAAADRPA